MILVTESGKGRHWMQLVMSTRERCASYHAHETGKCGALKWAPQCNVIVCLHAFSFNGPSAESGDIAMGAMRRDGLSAGQASYVLSVAT